MTEARRCEISLLNDRKLEILVQPKLLAGDLLDIAASHFGLREKEYFGLWFTDNMNQKRWLRNEKKVLDHGFSRNATTITLIFGIRLYVQSITHLKEAATIELFFLQASRLVYEAMGKQWGICNQPLGVMGFLYCLVLSFHADHSLWYYVVKGSACNILEILVQSTNKDELQCDNKTAFLLAAYVMQVTNGDYVSESITRDDMKNLRLLPTRLTKNGDDLEDESVEKVAFHYKRMNGLPRGDAIVNFLSIVERLPTYGVHFFDVKDKNETPWRLGISHRGIGQYDTEDSVTARKIYMWSRMENLFYRDKKFSIEIRDLTRAGSNQSMNSISKYATLRSRQSQATVDTWYLSTTSDAREIWALSVGYHQLFINNKDVQRFQAIKTLKDIAKELTKSSSSLAASVDSEFTGSTCSSDAFWYDQEDTESMYLDFVTALSSKKEMLERRLQERENELKELIRQENELTSDFQKRNRPGADSSVGATFRFSDSVLNTSGSNEELEKLTRDYEIQSQITAAAKRLSLDPKAKRRVRKERRILYEKASAKLKEIERKMKEVKANQMTPTGQSPKSFEDSYSERDDISESSSCRTPTQQDEFDTNLFAYPDKGPQLGRRTMSLQSGGGEGDYYNTLKANIRNSRKTSAESSPSSRRMIPNRYVIGDFDSSGIYSGLRNTRKNTLVDQYRSINGSSSLTQIPKLSQQFSNMTSASCDELEKNSGQNELDDTDYSNYITLKTEELRTRIHNLNNGPIEENVFHSGRPIQNQASGFGGSLLGGAAWSQLSQPSMIHMAPDIVSSYGTDEMSRDDELYYEEDECYLEESVMEDDQEREETLV